MDNLKLDDTLDFSALDVLSSSSTPRLLAQDRASIQQNMNQNNDQNKAKQIEASQDEPASEYSLHLSAIGGPSASSTLNLDREVLKIDSDEIGGPSDFTLNMADWINGDKKSLPRQSAAQHYQQPFVEDSNTPLVLRKIPAPKQYNNAPSSPPAAKQEGELLKSSQALTTPPQKPQDDLYAQVAALQAKCASLQQANDKLTGMLQSYRSNASRRTDLEAQLRHEQDARHQEMAAAEKVQQASDRQLQRAEERIELLQDDLNNERAARNREDVSTQQELQSQLAMWEQRANEYRQRVETLEVSEPQEPEIDELEQRLASLRASHKQELAAVRAEYDGVAKDVDEWMLAKIKAKDEHYAKVDARRQTEIARLKTRNQELEKMYSLCGKELMLSWGRNEFGVAPAGEKQRYRYQS